MNKTYQLKEEYLVVEILRTFFIAIPLFLVVYSLAMSACALKDFYDWTRR